MNTLNANSQLLTAKLETAFPFILSWDQNLRITHLGPGLSKSLPDARPGTRLQDIFLPTHSATGHPINDFRRIGSDPVQLDSPTHGLQLHGPVIAIPGDDFLMLATPGTSPPDAPEPPRPDLTDDAGSPAALPSAILQNAGFAIIATDTTGTITFFNPAAERLLGYSAAEVVGIIDPTHFHDPQEIAARTDELAIKTATRYTTGMESLTAYARNGRPDQREWSYRHKNGSSIPVLLTINALKDHSGITGYLAIAADLTKRKNSEQKIHSTISELERLNRVMMNREERVIELKKEINSVCQRSGLPPRYRSVIDPPTKNPPA
ncbi:MAG: PAS domain S-box protein [Verrucomicrobiales bacterium]|nr:PAS domain S-box protein [Verrucomicrobiota bacterium JB025]